MSSLSSAGGIARYGRLRRRRTRRERHAAQGEVTEIVHVSVTQAGKNADMLSQGGAKVSWLDGRATHKDDSSGHSDDFTDAGSPAEDVFEYSASAATKVCHLKEWLADELNIPTNWQIMLTDVRVLQQDEFIATHATVEDGRRYLRVVLLIASLAKIQLDLTRGYRAERLQALALLEWFALQNEQASNATVRFVTPFVERGLFDDDSVVMHAVICVLQKTAKKALDALTGATARG